MAPLLLPSWRVHVSTWLRFFLGNRLGPYHAMPQHVIDGMLNLAQGQLAHHKRVSAWLRMPGSLAV